MSDTPAITAKREAAAERPLAGRLWLAGTLRRLGLTPELVRFALAIFAISRAGFVLLTLLAQRFLAPIGSGTSSFVGTWVRYDASYYARLAADGYLAATPWRDAFFPLMPWLVHLVALPFEPLGPRYHADYIATLVVSNAAYLVALLGLAALAARDADLPTARRAMLYLTLFPSALFLFAGYAESLFLALAIWCVVALRHQRWWLAGALGLLAATTRQMGLFLVLPFAFSYASAHGWRWPHPLHLPHLPRQMSRLHADALAIVLIPGGLLLFMAWLWLAVGDPLAFEHAERYWHHKLTAPWATLAYAVPFFLGQTNPRFRADELIDIFCVVLFAILLILGIRRLPVGDLLFSVAIFVLVLTYPTNGWPLLSDARYMLEIFPCLLLLARLTRRPWQTALVLAVFTLLLVVQTQYFVRGALTV
ncbi:MAG TPA: mannosyltransferase family protein [Ktedonobacterales bacterium]|nr:mannosyltransferase family protein [Ktedonobacterales bacterium]